MASSPAVKLTGSAGAYQGTYRGEKIVLLFERTNYGDQGWNAYVEGRTYAICTDYPRVARYEALQVAVASIDAQSSVG
jgi:hypothetical protein